MSGGDLEFKLDKNLVEIIENQKEVDEMRNTYRQMRNELGGCKDYIASSTFIDKYGIKMGGYLSAILGAYDELNKRNE